MFGLDTVVLRLIGIIVAVIATFSFGYYKGYSSQKEKFDAYKVEIASAAKAQEEATKRAIQAQEQINKRTEIKYEKDISTLRAVYDRMRRTAGSSALPSVPDPATDPAQTTAYYLDVAPELAVQCAETTQQLTNLQDWVNEQGQVH